MNETYVAKLVVPVFALLVQNSEARHLDYEVWDRNWMVLVAVCRQNWMVLVAACLQNWMVLVVVCRQNCMVLVVVWRQSEGQHVVVGVEYVQDWHPEEGGD
jgi:hypothetical protein